jgi:hypothetical protein
VFVWRGLARIHDGLRGRELTSKITGHFRALLIWQRDRR